MRHSLSRFYKGILLWLRSRLTPLELLDRLSKLITPPRVHKHRYCGVLAPNAKLRRAVVETAGPSGATLQLLTEARDKMELSEAGDQSDDNQQGRARKLAARCWAMLLARIYECLPLTCPKCGQPMRLIAFIMEPVVVEKILSHIGEPTEPPTVLPARAPPQVEMDFCATIAQISVCRISPTSQRLFNSFSRTNVGVSTLFFPFSGIRYRRIWNDQPIPDQTPSATSFAKLGYLNSSKKLSEDFCILLIIHCTNSSSGTLPRLYRLLTRTEFRKHSHAIFFFPPQVSDLV